MKLNTRIRLLGAAAALMLGSVLSSTTAAAQERRVHLEVWYYDAGGQHVGTWVQGCGTGGDTGGMSGIFTGSKPGEFSQTVERYACSLYDGGPDVSIRKVWWVTLTDPCQIVEVWTWEGESLEPSGHWFEQRCKDLP